MYRAVFEAKDSGQFKVEAICGVQVVDTEAERFPTMIPFSLRSTGLTREPGEPFTLLWGSGFENARVCVEWYNDSVTHSSASGPHPAGRSRCSTTRRMSRCAADSPCACSSSR